MTTLRLYRGITVPGASGESTIDFIRRNGLSERKGGWEIRQPWPVGEDVSVTRAEALQSSEPSETFDRDSFCACGTEYGAAYYALVKNRHGQDDFPIMIEFDAHLDKIGVDGRDFLYSVVVDCDPLKVKPIVREIFGQRMLSYAEPAWKSEDPMIRLNWCMMGSSDPDVVRSHYQNRQLVLGRAGVVFENAFTVAYPVPAEDIRNVWHYDQAFVHREADISFPEIWSTSRVSR